jgi:hypothetical protein
VPGIWLWTKYVKPEFIPASEKEWSINLSE